MASDPSVVDLLKRHVTTRVDVGLFLVFSGAGAIVDAVWNFAPDATYYGIAPFVGALAVGVKKLLVDRGDPALSRVPDQPSGPDMKGRGTSGFEGP